MLRQCCGEIPQSLLAVLEGCVAPALECSSCCTDCIIDILRRRDRARKELFICSRVDGIPRLFRINQLPVNDVREGGKAEFVATIVNRHVANVSRRKFNASKYGEVLITQVDSNRATGISCVVLYTTIEEVSLDGH